MSLQELAALDEKLGDEGTALQQFIKEQQDLLRAEREADRLAERETREAKEKAALLEKEKLELQLQIEQTNREAIQNGHGQDVSAAPPLIKSPVPKLSKYEEGKDEMDAFLERFERFATSQDWPRDGWAVNVSSLLTGKGLTVYASMLAEEANDYQKLKCALLRSYDLNEDGYRHRFRETRPDNTETASQFIPKLQIYFGRWLAMAKVDKINEELRDLMLKEQFLSVCHEDLATFLRERMPELKSIEKMARSAERYVDARGCTLSSKTRKKDLKRKPNVIKPKLGNDADSPKAQGGSLGGGNGSKRPVECFICHKADHYAKECKAILAGQAEG